MVEYHVTAQQNQFYLNMKKVYFPLRYADEISISDQVLVHDNNNVVPAKVINISNSEMQSNCQSQRYGIIWISPFSSLLLNPNI